MRFDNLYLSGVASWLPPREPVGENRLDEENRVANAYRSIAVAGPQDAPPVMAARAGKAALERSGVPPQDVDLLLHASMGYQGLDFWSAAPYVHHCVLGENHHAPAIDVAQMCSGGLGGIELAASYLVAEQSRRSAVVTTADRFQPPGFDRWTSEGSSIIYGDGAAALVLSKDAGFARLLALRTVADTSLEPMCRGDNEFTVSSPAALGPVDNVTRRDAFLKSVGSDYVITRTNESLVAAVHGVLDEAGLAISDVGKFIFPNVGLGLLRAAYLDQLGLELEATAWELGRTTGHVGAADQITGLNHFVEQRRVVPGERVMLLGIGYGFIWSCAVVEVLELPQWSPAVEQPADFSIT